MSKLQKGQHFQSFTNHRTKPNSCANSAMFVKCMRSFYLRSFAPIVKLELESRRSNFFRDCNAAPYTSPSSEPHSLLAFLMSSVCVRAHERERESVHVSFALCCKLRVFDWDIWVTLLTLSLVAAYARALPFEWYRFCVLCIVMYSLEDYTVCGCCCYCFASEDFNAEQV